MTLVEILAIYLAFRAKQVVCDFFLQTSWMALNKGNPFREGGWQALGVHAAIHGLFTLLIVIYFAPQYWWLAVIDFFVHGAIDICKARMVKKKGWTYKDSVYWWAIGIDQEAHNITHLVYIILIAYGLGTRF